MRPRMRTPYSFRKEFTKNLPEFDPSRTDYSQRELELYSDALMWQDRDDHPQGPRILMQEHIEPDWRREVHAAIGTVDEEITKAKSKDGQTMYNRRHPEGRKVNSKQQRKVNGASYFR